MPGNVAVSSPSGVFPQTLSTSFTEDRSYLELQSMYHDGTIQRSQLATTSRRSFRLSKRLSFTEYATLKALWDSNGNTIPMFFYCPFDAVGAIGSNYDATGASVVGRVTVVFRMSVWVGTSALARVEVLDIQLIEVS